MAYFVPPDMINRFNDREKKIRHIREAEERKERLRKLMLQIKEDNKREDSRFYTKQFTRDATTGKISNYTIPSTSQTCSSSGILNTDTNTNDMEKITTKKTLVLTIEELYRVIPETRKLEGYNFKDLKELLSKLIEKIESSGNWEFVQYINNKPSYFIVRELTVKEVMYTQDDNPYEKIKNDVKEESTKKQKKEAVKSPEPNLASNDSLMTPPSITFTKLPWES